MFRVYVHMYIYICIYACIYIFVFGTPEHLFDLYTGLPRCRQATRFANLASPTCN